MTAVDGLSTRGGIAVTVCAGAGRIITGRLASELTLGVPVVGEDGCCNGSVDGGVDMCTDMDVCTGDGVDVQCCWLTRRGLGLGWGCGHHGALMMISTSSSESSCSGLSTTRRRFRRGLVVGV